jgi:hypothetical protein
VQLVFARPAGSLIGLNIIPAGLAIRSATAREQFRTALITALGRYGRVRAFSSVRNLIAAARAAQRDQRPLLH